MIQSLGLFYSVFAIWEEVIASAEEKLAVISIGLMKLVICVSYHSTVALGYTKARSREWWEAALPARPHVIISILRARLYILIKVKTLPSPLSAFRKVLHRPFTRKKKISH